MNDILYFFVQTPLPTSVFGQITPVGPNIGSNPVTGISNLIIFGIQMLLTVAAIALLVYLLWGAFDWVTSGGDPENLTKARSKMTHAVLGMILIVAALAIFMVVAGNILGVMVRDSDGNWIFKLPTLRSCAANGMACDPTKASTCCSGNCMFTGAGVGQCR